MELEYKSYKWLDKLNSVNSKILLPIAFVLILFFNTAINIWTGGIIESVQNLIAIGVLFIVLINFVVHPKTILIPWIKTNYLIVGYFIIRGITWIQSGFDYSVLRTICFEAFFIIGIGTCLANKKASIKPYQKIYIITEFVLSLLCIVAFFIGKVGIDGVQSWLAEYTYYDKYNTTAFFVNPNTGGLMAGFAITLSIIIYKKHKCKWLILYVIYNIAFLFFQGSRNAILATVLIIVVMIAIKFLNIKNKKQITALALTGCLILMAGVYAFTWHNIDIAPKYMSDTEYKISRLSSDRYIIWKECITEQQDHLLFGAGNLSIEQQNRQEMFTDGSYSYLYPKATEFGPHNGYIGMISGAGLLGFIVFMGILFQNIWRAKALNKGNWYLAIIFILVINLFESLLVLNRYFTCFYLFLILALNDEEELE